MMPFSADDRRALLRSVAEFVTPPLLTLGTEAPFELVWRPGGPWA
jgi:hypothetical protein